MTISSKSKSTHLLVPVLVLTFANQAQAATHYVAKTGIDSSSCGTSDSPCLTITYAYNNKTTAGDIIIVKSGTYTDYYPGYGLRLTKSGTASAPITIKSETKWGAILDGENRSATDRHSVVWISGNYNIIEGFDIKRGHYSGAVVYGNHNQVRNNNIHNNGTTGDPASDSGHDGGGASPTSTGTIWYGNHIHHNGRPTCNPYGTQLTPCNLDHGIYSYGKNESIINNVITYNMANGVVTGNQGTYNWKIYNNTIAFNRYGITLWEYMEGVDIKNNIIYKNALNGVLTWRASGSGIAIDRNVVFGNGSPWTLSGASYSLGTNYTTSDPQLVAETSDYHLQSTSPAIDKGISLTVVFSDADGVNRPQGSAYDIGAYEFSSTTPSNAPPTAPTELRVQLK